MENNKLLRKLLLEIDVEDNSYLSKESIRECATVPCNYQGVSNVKGYSPRIQESIRECATVPCNYQG